MARPLFVLDLDTSSSDGMWGRRCSEIGVRVRTDVTEESPPLLTPALRPGFRYRAPVPWPGPRERGTCPSGPGPRVLGSGSGPLPLGPVPPGPSPGIFVPGPRGPAPPPPPPPPARPPPPRGGGGGGGGLSCPGHCTTAVLRTGPVRTASRLRVGSRSGGAKQWMWASLGTFV